MAINSLPSSAPCVTVLMPVYNGEPYLSESIESILNQSLSDFEFVIVDDGSTDRTPQILRDYAARDSRIFLVRQRTNQGLIATLNAGMQRARGEFVARQDADDISLAQRLEAQVSYLRDHPEVGLLGSCYFRFKDDGPRRLRRPPKSDLEIRWRLLFGNIWCHSSVMFRRSLLPLGEPPYRDFLHAEDYDLWTRLLRSTKTATLPEPLVEYREHAAGILGSFSDQSMEMARKISLREINTLPLKHKVTPAEHRLVSRCRSVSSRDTKNLDALTRLFEIFDAFAAHQGDTRGVRSLRSGWLRVKLVRLSVSQRQYLSAKGHLRFLFQREPVATTLSYLLDRPRYTLRQIVSRTLRPFGPRENRLPKT